MGYEWTLPRSGFGASSTLKSGMATSICESFTTRWPVEAFINGVSAGTQNGIVEDYQEIKLSAEARKRR